MRGTLEAARHRADVRVARFGGGVAGALVALPPWTFPLAPPGAAAQLRTLWAQGFRAAARWRTVFELLQRHHPPEPVAYLSLLGVSPNRQGEGVGTALLRAWLADVDAAGQTSWLETARAANLPFYRRHGFEVAGELAVFDVPVWLMQRPPGAAPEGSSPPGQTV